MLNFVIAWGITLIGLKIYLSKKKVNIGLNNDVISLVLSFIIIVLLNLIQFLFEFLINIIIK
jgi:hypothetical protein